MVGRDTELKELDCALSQVRSRAGRAAFVVGEAGIGKSRLTNELICQATAMGMKVLRGRGSTIGPMVPFRPLAEGLMSLLRTGESLDHAELAPYSSALGRLVPEWGRDGPHPGDLSLVVLAESVLRLVSAVGRETGCLMVVEDLQECDAETLAVVEYLADNLAGQPAMLLATVRTEPGKALDLVRAAIQRDAGTYLELGRLDKAEVAQLAALCLEVEPEGVPGPAIAELWQRSAGVPFVVEELLHGMLAAGVLTRQAGGWHFAGHLRAELPSSLARSVVTRADRLGPDGRAVLAVAATLGHRFPVAVVQEVTGLDDGTLLGHLQAAVTVQLITVDTPPDWYSFQHPLTAEALRAQLARAERSELSRRAADAIRALHPGLPGEWCQQVAVLLLDAGDTAGAAKLFAEAGRRALADGAPSSAITLLERAEQLLTGIDDSGLHADVLESLLLALAEAGQLDRALQLIDNVDTPRLARLDAGRRAALHIRFAWVATAGGRMSEAEAQVVAARTVLGPDAPAEHTAPVDAVAAELLLDIPGKGRVRDAELAAERALVAARRAGLAAIECQALQTLGMIARGRDRDDAMACFERARSIADEHGLSIPRVHAVTQLAAMDWLFDGIPTSTRLVHHEALRIGAIRNACNLEAVLALYEVLYGNFEEAAARMEKCLADATRLRLAYIVRYVLMCKAVLAAHQAHRKELEAAYAEFHRMGGPGSLEMPLVLGLARAFCALLEEDHELAYQELRRTHRYESEYPSTFHLTGSHGLRLLLGVLAGDAGREDYEAVAHTARGQMRWNRQFVLLANAVLLGGADRPDDAAAAFEEAQRAAEPYAMARRLGPRLVAPFAIADGWGDPVTWLRDSEEYFHRAAVHAVAAGCRTLLRRAGASVLQRRPGVERVPGMLRAVGVTVREYEVLELLTERLSNKAIAERLHISVRTVEKHVAKLMSKTERPDRDAVARHAAQLRQDRDAAIPPC